MHEKTLDVYKAEWGQPEVKEEEEHLAGIEMEKLDINELLDDKDSDEMDKEQEK